MEYPIDRTTATAHTSRKYTIKERREKMPPVFKKLASISVWILFISGCIAAILSPIARIVTGAALPSLIAWGIGVACLFLSVVAIRIRKTLD